MKQLTQFVVAGVSAMTLSTSVFASSCLPEYTTAETETLKLLTDVETISDVYDVQYRMSTIAQTLGERADPRGTFPVVYSVMTDEATRSVSEGYYEDQEKAEELLIEFASRYFENYNAYLNNASMDHHWVQYFNLTEDCSRETLRLAASGINSHITIDLAAAVDAIDAPKDFKDDFDLYGSVLVTKANVINEKMYEYYGVDGTEFFSGFFLGEWYDKFNGTGAATELAFTVVRTQAWVNGRLLQRPLFVIPTYTAMNVSFYNRELILANLEKTGLLNGE